MYLLVMLCFAAKNIVGGNIVLLKMSTYECMVQNDDRSGSKS